MVRDDVVIGGVGRCGDRVVDDEVEQVIGRKSIKTHVFLFFFKVIEDLRLWML